MANTRFEGLSFARQGLQVATLVVVPLFLVLFLIGGILLIPDLGENDWLIIVISMVFIFLIAMLTLRAYFKWAVVPCTVEIGSNEITVLIEKKSLFYPFGKRVFKLENISNACCNLDERLAKSFITLSTRKPKATYCIQYLDDRADDTNPEVWQQIEAMLIEYNGDSRHEQIGSVGFFQGGLMNVLLVMSGLFFIAFFVALIVDSDYRTWDRMPTYISFGVLFIYLLALRYTTKKRNNT